MFYPSLSKVTISRSSPKL